VFETALLSDRRPPALLASLSGFRAKPLLRGLSGDPERLADLGPALAVSPAILDCDGRQALDLARTNGKRSERDERLVRVRE
jgi:hypothetical protein